MNMVGYESETNRVFVAQKAAGVNSSSPAASAGMKSGDRILKINDRDIVDFEDIQAQVIFSDGQTLKVLVERDNQKKEFTVTPALNKYSGHYAMGIRPYGDRVMIGGVKHNDAADYAGLESMDVVLSLDGKKFKTEEEFIEYVKPRSGKKIVFSVLRRGEEKKIIVTPRTRRLITMNGRAIMDMENLEKLVRKMSLARDGERIFSADNFIEYIEKNRDKKVTLTYEKEKVTGKINYEDRGYIGVGLAIKPHMVPVEYDLKGSLAHAFIDPYDWAMMNLKGLAMVFSGKVNLRENLAGPIRIGQIAGDVAYYKGLSAFILLIAKISIILMVMNLLPIPAVDGSHLVFYFIEMIRRKPIDQKIMERIQVTGVLLLIMLGVFVIINDISMLPAIQRLFQ